jgi:hypothetical protein
MAIIEAIATEYLEADAASFEWTSIPSTYESLAISLTARTTHTSVVSISMQFGTGGGAVDTGGNYSQVTRYSIASTNYSTAAASSTEFLLYYFLPSLAASSGSYAQSNMVITGYANTNKNTTFQSNEGRADPTAGRVQVTGGVWDNTAAVDRIKLASQSGDFRRGSEFTLYGIKSS